MFVGRLVVKKTNLPHVLFVVLLQLNSIIRLQSKIQQLKDNMTTQDTQAQRSLLNEAVSEVVCNLMNHGSKQVCTKAGELGIDMFFPAQTTGRMVKLIGPAADLVERFSSKAGFKVLNTGSISVRTCDESGNPGLRIDLNTFVPISPDPQVSPGGWWSAGLVEADSASGASALCNIFQDHSIECITLGTAMQWAKDNEEHLAQDNLQAIANFAFPIRGSNFLKKKAKPRYDLDKMIVIWEVSGGPDNDERSWSNFYDRAKDRRYQNRNAKTSGQAQGALRSFGQK